MSAGSTVALITWGDLWEDDFLDTINISFETFCNEFMGSWMFGYVEALQKVGVKTVIFCFSARVKLPSRFTHSPTGTTICVIPASRIYRAVRRLILNPYGNSVDEMFGTVRGTRHFVLAILKEIKPYLTTPLYLLARELRREGCNIILCQGYDDCRFDICVLLGKLIGLPVFATFQGGADRQLGYIERFIRPLTLSSCAGLIIASMYEVQRMHLRYNLPLTKIARIFNPIDLTEWNAFDRAEARAIFGIPITARVVVWHGRVNMYTKGLDILLDAWDKVCSERPGQDLRLVLVGTGHDADKLHHLIKARQLRGVIWVDKFLNDRTVIRRYLSMADVFAFPSRVEGFPVAPLEAMACSLPVVAVNAMGIIDILEGREASGGIVVPSEDAVSLALSLGHILDNEAWGNELGKRARRRVEAYFSFEAIGKQLHGLFLSQDDKVVLSTSYVYNRLPEDPIYVKLPLEVKAISPNRVLVRNRFNVQLNGLLTLTITAENASPGTLAVMDNTFLVTVYRNPSCLIAKVPNKLLKKPAAHFLYLTDAVRESNRVEFVVIPPHSINNDPKRTRIEPIFEGYLDRADCQTISGWAWDANRPYKPIKVDIYTDNILVTTIKADEYRQDLEDTGKGNGRHAFTYIVPHWLKDEKPHSIRVRVTGTDFDLCSTPKQIICNSALMPTYKDFHPKN